MEKELSSITINEKDQRFELVIDGKLSFAEYLLFDHGIIYPHTVVHPELEGRGVGSSLAKFALEYARERSLKVVPLCPFISAYIQRHKEYKTLL
jgi:predicted GNAT family acetyltransferase